MAQELGICHSLAVPCQLTHLAPLRPAQQWVTTACIVELTSWVTWVTIMYTQAWRDGNFDFRIEYVMWMGDNSFHS